MKGIKSLLVASLLGGTLGLGLSGKAQAQEECSVATLQGEYLVTGGAVAPLDQRDDPTFPRTAVDVWNFDGQGGLSGFTRQNQGGRISGGDFTPGVPTYDMDPERCVATVTFGGGAQWVMVITRDGSEGAGIRVDTDDEGRANIATRFMKKR